MYKYILSFAIVFIGVVASFAQSKTPSMAEVLKKQKAMTTNSGGVVKFNFGNKSYSYHCQLIANKTSGVYLFTVAFADAAESNLNIILTSINDGKNYTIADDKKKISTAVINGNAYQIFGSVTLTKKGKTISGSFDFDAFFISKNNSKAEKKSDGKITGTLTNISIP